MKISTCLVTLATLVAPAAAAPSGTELTYRGTMVAEKGNPVETQKDFDLTVVVAETGDAATKLYWTVQEKARGSWPWTEHFGGWQLDANWRGDRDLGPSLLYEREAGLSVVPIVSPLVKADQPLATGLTWTADRLEHRVAGAEKQEGQDTWRVEVRSPFGHKRTLWVDKESGVVRKMVETVFIGQGEQHELKLTLAATKRLNPLELENSRAAFDAFLKLRDDLGVKRRDPAVTWNADQLTTLRARLPTLVKQAEGQALAVIAAKASRDTTDQKGRNGALAVMRKKILGRGVGEFQFAAVSGDPLTDKNLKGQVTVLHFWEYRDSPLQEPYGQIGYLDYLHRRRKDTDIRIYGVNVDRRLSDPATRRKAIASARKLRSFMNLSYPILLDAGSIIAKFGDPRAAGAKLPLYVVLDRDGKVIHYHAGLYDVDRDRGLKELDDVVTSASDKKK